MTVGGLHTIGRASFFRATGNKWAFMLDSGVVSSDSQHSPTQSPDRSHIILDDPPPPPKQKWVLTAESFQGMLMWLNRDPNEAGKKYEEIRLVLIKRFRQLIKRFPQLGNLDPENLANETFDRVSGKLPEIIATYVGPPEPYFCSVGYNVFREYLRKPIIMPLTTGNLPQPDQPSADEETEKEGLYSCLQHCMDLLSSTNRVMITEYYYGERQEKIKRRKELAERLGITLAVLRLRAQRVRSTLKKCILACMETKGQERDAII